MSASSSQQSFDAALGHLLAWSEDLGNLALFCSEPEGHPTIECKPKTEKKYFRFGPTKREAEDDQVEQVLRQWLKTNKESFLVDNLAHKQVLVTIQCRYRSNDQIQGIAAEILGHAKAASSSQLDQQIRQSGEFVRYNAENCWKAAQALDTADYKTMNGHLLMRYLCENLTTLSWLPEFLELKVQTIVEILRTGNFERQKPVDICDAILRWCRHQKKYQGGLISLLNVNLPDKSIFQLLPKDKLSREQFLDLFTKPAVIEQGQIVTWAESLPSSTVAVPYRIEYPYPENRGQVRVTLLVNNFYAEAEAILRGTGVIKTAPFHYRRDIWTLCLSKSIHDPKMFSLRWSNQDNTQDTDSKLRVYLNNEELIDRNETRSSVHGNEIWLAEEDLVSKEGIVELRVEMT